MKKITFPLKLGTKSPKVSNLQEALQLLLDKSVILQNDEAARRELSAGLQEERAEQTFGDFSTKVVSIFQKEQNLKSSNIDKKTVDALNKLLQEKEVLPSTASTDAAALDSRYTVLCCAVDSQGKIISGLRIEAYDQDPKSPHDPLGEPATTDTRGMVIFRFKSSDFTEHHGEKGPDLYFKVYRKETLLDYSLPGIRNDKGVIRGFQPQREPIVIMIDKHYVVMGVIVQNNSLPAQGMDLFIYNLGFGGNATLLGSPKTDAKGCYSLTYNPGDTAVNLELRIKDPQAEAKEIPLVKPRFGAKAHEIMNLIAPSVKMAAEYRRMSADLKLHVGEVTRLADARENAERHDLTMLNRATGWDARLIALAVTAMRLSVDSEVNLPHEALYGLLRGGLPSDKLMLAQVEPDVVEKVLKDVNNAGIVELTDQQIGQFKNDFIIFATKKRLTIPAPGSRSTYGDLLKASDLDDDVQAKFASVYFSHRGDSTQLWEEARNAGLDDIQVGRLQLQGKLAFLAGNSEAMTTRIMQKLINEEQIKDPVQLVEQDFYRSDQWKAEIKALAGDDEQKLAALIPVVYSGKKVEDRLNAYAEDMARKVRLSYPTQVVGCMIENEEIKLPVDHVETAKLLKRAALEGFRLGQTPVETFLKMHDGIAADMPDNEIHIAQQQMKILQRVYQITPSNEAIPVIMSLGITSAYDVMAYSEAMFKDLYDAKYLEIYGKASIHKDPHLIYRKAKQVSSVTYNLFTVAKKISNDPRVAGISATVEVRESVRNELIKHFPTMESLFGSMDFCECEHCRSVLSPAAYLVDLLQFIDSKPETQIVNQGEQGLVRLGYWDNFLLNWKAHNVQEYSTKYKNPYEALIERRPDLPYILLNCENTNKALPYIDIVNEILEYYVANENLTKDAAHDTGDATSEELCSEPLNVIAGAYNKLQQARYPLNLPFDLWIETVRSFCNYFGTPLSQLLETFRSSDELFIATQPYDLSAIFIESLGLSQAEYAIFTDPNPLKDDKWYELYGYSTVKLVDVPTQLKSAKILSRKLGVTYKELVEIIQTDFVNPKLVKLALLYKLNVTVHDVMLYRDTKAFYGQNKDLMKAEREKLILSEQQRFDNLTKKKWEQLYEVEAFEKKLDNLTAKYQFSGIDFKSWLNNEIGNNAFDDILVLADSETGCDFDLTTLRYAGGKPADVIAFLKINLFVRLWRKLGWTIEETDRALNAFVPKSTPFDAEEIHLNKQPLKTALIYLAHFKVLDEQLKVGKSNRVKLITLWSDIATVGKNPLYAQLFLTHSVLKSGEVFDDVTKSHMSIFDNPLGQYLSETGLAAMVARVRHEVSLENIKSKDKIDPAAFADWPKVSVDYDKLREVQSLAYQGVLTDTDKAQLTTLSPSPVLAPLLDAIQTKAKEFTLIKDHMLALQGALGLTADDINCILKDAEKPLDKAELSLPNVSILYRYGLLAKALKLSVRELIAFKQISGLDPFKQLHPEPLADTSAGVTSEKKAIDFDYPFTNTLRFVEVVEEVKQSGLEIEDLEYLLRHRFDETGKYRPNREGTLALLKTLAEGIHAIRTEHAVPEDPSTLSEEALRQKLGLVLSPDVVERFLSMMNGTAEYTATKTGVAPENKLKQEEFTDEPAIQQVRYTDVRQEQKLTFRGVLFDAEKVYLKARIPNPVFSDLLDDIQKQAYSFFEKHLQKQVLNVQHAGGFLDEADFKLLFDLNLAFSDGETEQDRVRNRRMKLTKAFLPFIQQRMISQFVVQTMIAYTGADTLLVESLLSEKWLLVSPKTLLGTFGAIDERGVSADFFDSVDGTGVRQPTIPSVRDVDTSLKDKKDKDGKPLKPANSALFKGYLEVPISGAYRFYVVKDKKEANAELRFDHLPDPVFLKDEDITVLDKFLELKPGVPYSFTLELKNLNGGGVRLLVQGETLSKDSVSQLKLYPFSAMAEAEKAVLLLAKALQLVQSLGLNEREIRYILTHATDFGGLKLSQLPTQRIGDTPAEISTTSELFSQFLRLTDYARLKRDLAGSTDDLIGIFEVNETGDLGKVYKLISTLTRRDEETIKASANALVVAPNFANEKLLQHLWKALQVVERFGVPVASLLKWTRIVSPAATQEQRFTIACDLKEAIKARFELETWQGVAQPIFDKLRQHQRDSLVAYIIHKQGFTLMEQLYEYFLIDPGMEPVVQTSRIRLAISSVQLFIQRCLLNMERQVHPSVINSKQWEWIKRYRVWEANRKIFLFPENWLEPEFRDDKTHLFTELEGALLQGDVSSDLVEDAFLNYLKKLDELARLDIVAMHIEDKPDPSLRTLHVIGRTYGKTHKYFYRRYTHQMWTPWEPVNAEIEGDHLAPVIWRGRLYLFWVTFLDKANENAQPGSNTEKTSLVQASLQDLMSDLKEAGKKKQIDMQLHWSEYLQGEWSTCESSDFVPVKTIRRFLASGRVVPLTVPSDFDPKSVFIHVSTACEAGEERGVYIHLSGEIEQVFYLASRNSSPEVIHQQHRANGGRDVIPLNRYSAIAKSATRYAGGGELKVTFNERITTEPEKINIVDNPSSILQKCSAYTLLPCDNNLTAFEISEDTYQDAENPDAVEAAIKSGLPEILSLMKPIFYQDNEYTLFAEPNVVERTIEDWKDWVTHTSQPVLDLDLSKEPLEEFRKPQIPDLGYPPLGLSFDLESLINLTSGHDWLVNSGTVLLFDDGLLGPTGQMGLEILTADKAAGIIEEGRTPVNVNYGSGLKASSTVVLTGATTFEKLGITQVAGGLNVVGSGGFNSMLAQNFNALKNSGLDKGKLDSKLINP
jgi:hypothetical protein